MSCCDTLEVLHCPWAVFSALPATCPTFPRLTELHLEGGADEATSTWRRRPGTSWPTVDCPPSPRSTSTASSLISWGWGGGGGLPAGACLRGCGGHAQAVDPHGDPGGDGPAGRGLLRARRGDRQAAAPQVPQLELFSDGRDYHAVGRGLAASGGCPELFEVEVTDSRGTSTGSPTSPA
jgi:hypothetical protein